MATKNTVIKINSRGLIKLPSNIIQKLNNKVCFLESDGIFYIYSETEAEKIMNMLKEGYKQKKISREEYKIMNREIFSNFRIEEVSKEGYVKSPVKSDMEECSKDKMGVKIKRYAFKPKEEN